MSDIIEAIKEDNFLKIKQAIKQGADLNQMVEVGEDDEYVLLFFALRERVSCDSFKLLVESGANLDYFTEDGVSVLDEAVVFGDLEILAYLVDEKGCDVKKTERKSGMTPFMQSCCYGKVEVAEFLASRGADIDVRDKMGMSALDYTKRLQQKKMQTFIEKLLENQ
jgi:ankyrin repeat protein